MWQMFWGDVWLGLTDGTMVELIMAQWFEGPGPGGSTLTASCSEKIPAGPRTEVCLSNSNIARGLFQQLEGCWEWFSPTLVSHMAM